VKATSGKSPIAFDFVLEELYSVDPKVRAMFGSHAVYVKDKIVLILRNRENHRNDNGVWLATSPEHHPSLRKDFPSLRTIGLLGSVETAWQNLPVEDERFEEEVMKACQLILKGDPRIGTIPRPRKKKNKTVNKGR
jgi:hypothetical protein